MAGNSSKPGEQGQGQKDAKHLRGGRRSDRRRHVAACYGRECDRRLHGGWRRRDEQNASPQRSGEEARRENR